MDDGADCELDLNPACFAAQTIRSDLAKAGIVANSSKSIWIPTQVMEWLGLIWNLREGFLAIMEARLQKLLDSLHSLKNQLPHVTPRFLASVVGRIVSFRVGNVCLLMSRYLQSVANFRDSWYTKIDRSVYLFFLPTVFGRNRLLVTQLFQIEWQGLFSVFSICGNYTFRC